MLWHKIQNQENLSPSEQVVADFVITSPERVLAMNIRELADAIFVSAATVTRFCRKVGFESFQQLKVELAVELSRRDETAPFDFSAGIPTRPTDSVATIFDNIVSIHRAAVEETRRIQDIAVWEKVIRAVACAKEVDFYGLSYSLDSAIHFRSRMMDLGYSIFWTQDTTRQLHQSCNSKPGAVACLISYSGRTALVLKYARILKARGVPTLSITCDRDNPLQKLTTWNFPLALLKKDSYYDHTAVINACAEIAFILNALFTAVFRYDYDENVRRIKIDRLLQEQAKAPSDQNQPSSPLF